MTFDGPSFETPPIQKTPAMQVQPEVKKAALDEEERKKRITMNRQKSRSSLPYLQRPVGTGLSEKL